MNKSLTTLRGSIVAIVTPFDRDENIDFKAFERLLQFHIDNGTDGIVVCGTTGETPTLTHAEDEALIQFTVNYIDGRIPVIAGTGSNCTKTAIANSQTAESLGVDGILVASPYYNKPTEAGMYQHFKHIAESVSIPIILYNVPGRTAINMSPELMFKLATDFKNILGVKEASGNMSQISYLLENRPEGFLVFSGDDILTLEMIRQGAEGCVSVVANEIPAEYRALCHAALDGRWEEAEEIQNRYASLMELNFIESNPIPVKTALHSMGLIENYFRLPMCPMSDSKSLLQELKDLKII